MIKVLSWMETILVIVGALLVITGAVFAVPLVLSVGLAMLGVGLIAGALEAIVTRRVTFLYTDAISQPEIDPSRALSAVVWGVFEFLIGAAVLVFAVARMSGQSAILVGYLKAHPGVALAVGGLTLVVAGMNVTVGSKKEAGSSWWILGRVLGILLILLGLVLLAGGLLEMFARPTYDRLLDSIAR